MSRQTNNRSITLWLAVLVTGYSTISHPQIMSQGSQLSGGDGEGLYRIERTYFTEESFRPIAVAGELTLMVDGRTPTILLVDERGDLVSHIDTSPLIPTVGISVERKVYLFGEPTDLSGTSMAIFDLSESDALTFLPAYFRVSSGVYDKITDSLVLADIDSETLIVLTIASLESQYSSGDESEVEPRRLYLKGGPPARFAHDMVNGNLYVSHVYEPQISTVSIVQGGVIDSQRNPFGNPTADVALTATFSDLERVHLFAYDKYQKSILLFDMAQCGRSLCVSDSMPASVNTPFFGKRDKDPRSSSVHLFTIRPGELIVAQAGSDRIDTYRVDLGETSQGRIEHINSFRLPRNIEYFLRHPDRPCVLLTTDQGQVFEFCGEPVIPTVWPNGYYGYQETRSPSDRDEELIHYATREKQNLERVPGRARNKSFYDLCREVGKACHRVLDWERNQWKCGNSAEDGSRMAFCTSNPKNGYYALGITRTEQDREENLFDLSGDYFVRLKGSSSGKSFHSVCESIGKQCSHVTDWEGVKMSCFSDADDGSRMAMCIDNPKPINQMEEAMR